MEARALRLLIREKLEDGRLPHDHMPRVWGGPGNGETCDACEETVTKGHLLMEGVSVDESKRAVQFHVPCFYVWDDERVAPGRDDDRHPSPNPEEPQRHLLREPYGQGPVQGDGLEGPVTGR